MMVGYLNVIIKSQKSKITKIQNFEENSIWKNYLGKWRNQKLKQLIVIFVCNIYTMSSF